MKEVIMTKAKVSLLLLSVLLLAGCVSGKSSPNIVVEKGSLVARNGCHGQTYHDHAKEKPGCYAVSTMKPGQQFDTQANFAYFKACGRPCWLPIYPYPALVEGKAVTKGHPCEYYVPTTASGYCEGANIPADSVTVICQLHGKLPPGLTGDTTLKDEASHTSDIWDQIVVPLEDLAGNKAGLKPSPDGEGYLAYGSDLWLENTGWHNIPCK